MSLLTVLGLLYTFYLMLKPMVDAEKRVIREAASAARRQVDREMYELARIGRCEPPIGHPYRKIWELAVARNRRIAARMQSEKEEQEAAARAAGRLAGKIYSRAD